MNEGITKLVCSVAGCERIVDYFAMQMCAMHYRRTRRRGEPGLASPVKGPRYAESPICIVDGCERHGAAAGYCLMHYKRVQRHGQPGAAAAMFRPGQNDNLDDNGYRRVRVGGKRVKEHRHVMEQILGRPLLPEENVHHINGVRHDNRPENLELWSTSQPCGQRVADKVAWARHILSLYGDRF